MVFEYKIFNEIGKWRIFVDFLCSIIQLCANESNELYLSKHRAENC